MQGQLVEVPDIDEIIPKVKAGAYVCVVDNNNIRTHLIVAAHRDCALSCGLEQGRRE